MTNDTRETSMQNTAMRNPAIRNIAIIAHVDHGKTTLVDAMLRQSGIFRANQAVVDRVMDSNDLERERGITILAKNTALTYHDTKINIVDTPGHSDFGGEVERALRMVDGVLLLVDASEGPLPQTRYVLQKALPRSCRRSLCSIRSTARTRAQPRCSTKSTTSSSISTPPKTSSIFRCFTRTRKRASRTARSATTSTNLQPLFETIVSAIPAPSGDPQASLQIQVTNLDYSDYSRPHRDRARVSRHAAARRGSRHRQT